MKAPHRARARREKQRVNLKHKSQKKKVGTRKKRRKKAPKRRTRRKKKKKLGHLSPLRDADDDVFFRGDGGGCDDKRTHEARSGEVHERFQ